MRFIYLDGKQMTDERKAHELIAQILPLPPKYIPVKYEYNLESLRYLLQFYDTTNIVVFLNTNALRENLGGYAEQLLQAFRDWEKRNEKYGCTLIIIDRGVEEHEDMFKVLEEESGIHRFTDNANFVEVRDGFVFNRYGGPETEYDMIIMADPEDIKQVRPAFHTLEETIEYVRIKQLEKCDIKTDEIEFLDRCPSLKCIFIDCEKNGDLDFSPLYRRPFIEDLFCNTEYGPLGEEKPVNNPIDFSRFQVIKAFGVYGNGTTNLFANETVEEIITSYNKTYTDFRDAKSVNLLRLDCTAGGLKTLDGIGNFLKLERLNLNYQYGLKDISGLSEVSSTLKQLIIEGCGKIKDYSVLEKMHNLEILHLKGSGKIDSIRFLEKLPNLKSFQLDMNCLDGDMTPCKGIPHVRIKNKKHYNMKQDSFLDDKSVPLPEVWRF